MKSKPLTQQVETLGGYYVVEGALTAVGVLVIIQGELLVGLICGAVSLILSFRQRHLKRVRFGHLTKSEER